MSKNRRHNRWGTRSGAVTSPHGRSGPDKRTPTMQEPRAHDPVYSPGHDSLHPCEIEDIESGATVRGGGVGMVALKPCPFCGADDPELFIFDPDCAYDYWAVCTTCGASSEPGAPENATISWNRRHPLASDEELRVMQDCASETYDEARAHAEDHRRWSNSCLHAALAASAQRDAATLSALERRLRGVDE